MTAHTVGPWSTQGWVPTWAYVPVKDARHNVICLMYPDAGRGYTRDEVAANAHAIAALPDLLAALKELVSTEDSELPRSHAARVLAWEAARAALEKAES